MARQYTMVCDACGRKQTEKTPIISCVGKREDNVKYSVDLCPSCWKRLEDEFGVRQDETKPRREFEVVNFEDIPRDGA